MKITKKLFGTLPGEICEGMADSKNAGKEIYNYVLENDHGVTIEISEYGACIVKILVPDKNGVVEDVQLGYDDLAGYMGNSSCLGALVGRNANRTAGAEFTLNGKNYKLLNNDSGANLHSDVPDNYFRRPYDFVKEDKTEDSVSVKLHLFSPNMDQGFPGNLDLYVTYTLKQDGSLVMHYEAESDMDTIFNVTNHSYINLCGNEKNNAVNEIVWIDADQVTENKKGNLPTGKFLEVAGTPLDFNTPKCLKDVIDSDHYMMNQAGGYDFNYVMKHPGTLSYVAYMLDPESGRKLEVYTDLPGLQLYTGNGLNKLGKNGVLYGNRGGICFESQQFPDCVHFEQFPSSVIKAGVPYETTTVFKFVTEK